MIDVRLINTAPNGDIIILTACRVCRKLHLTLADAECCEASHYQGLVCEVCGEPLTFDMTIVDGIAGMARCCHNAACPSFMRTVQR